MPKFNIEDASWFTILNTPVTDFTIPKPPDLKEPSDYPFWPTLTILGQYRKNEFYALFQTWQNDQLSGSKENILKFLKEKKDEINQIMQSQIPQA
jgi:hypothetical protein